MLSVFQTLIKVEHIVRLNYQIYAKASSKLQKGKTNIASHCPIKGGCIEVLWVGGCKTKLLVSERMQDLLIFLSLCLR